MKAPKTLALGAFLVMAMIHSVQKTRPTSNLEMVEENSFYSIIGVTPASSPYYSAFIFLI